MGASISLYTNKAITLLWSCVQNPSFRLFRSVRWLYRRCNFLEDVLRYRCGMLFLVVEPKGLQPSRILSQRQACNSRGQQRKQFGGDGFSNQYALILQRSCRFEEPSPPNCFLCCPRECMLDVVIAVCLAIVLLVQRLFSQASGVLNVT